MGLTTSQALLRATARASFWQRYQGYPSIMEGLVMTADSNADQETYPGLAYAPGVREMTGDRHHRSVPEFSYTIVNNKYEATVDIGYKLWRFGKLGAVESMLGSMGAKARAHPDELVATLINTGDAVAGHDEQYFFSAAHVDVGAAYTTAQDNDFTSVAAADPAVPTDLEFAAAARTMIDSFYGVKDGDGDPYVPGMDAQFVCLVPAVMLSVARQVANNDQLTGPVSNDLKGMFQVRHNPWSDAPTEFFMFWTNGARKPFIIQTADPIILEDNLGGDSQYESKDVSFGTFGFYNAGYGDWRHGTRHIFTT